MESNSKPNRILCSERAYNLLVEQDPEMPIKKRGRVAVKGKGDMNVYWYAMSASILFFKANHMATSNTYLPLRINFWCLSGLETI